MPRPDPDPVYYINQYNGERLTECSWHQPDDMSDEDWADFVRDVLLQFNVGQGLIDAGRACL